MQNNIWLTSSHLAGSLNIETDQQSRQFNERTEWYLRPDVFNKITKLWGVPEIGLFASRLNNQLPKFVS